MRVLVTGGTGYLGAAIVRSLQSEGCDPVVFARRASVSGLPGTHIDGDVRDRAAVTRAVGEADAVIHTAALVSIWRPRPGDFDDVNVQGLHHVLDAARETGRHVVYTSSFLALPPAGRTVPLQANDYQRTKVEALRVARQAAAGQPLTILFPGVVYGPGVMTEGNLVGRLLADHLQGRLPGLIGADRRWSYAYVEDVAAAHVAAVRRFVTGEFLLGGENAPQLRVFELLREERGVPLPRRIPYALATVAAVADEARTRLSGRAPLLTRGVVEIFRYDWPVDSARSLQELSYRVLPLAEGIRRALASMS
jgi:NAD+-dependent farnesol dehydrogenase